MAFRRLAPILFGLGLGVLVAEAGMRLLAPAVQLAVRSSAREEAYRHGVSLLRTVDGTRIPLTASELSTPADVVAVGDSNVFGLLVAERDSWPAQLAGRSGQRVLNLGIPGTAPCTYNHMLAVALQELPAPPATVLYAVSANDFTEPACTPLRDEDLFVRYADGGLRLPTARNLWLRLRVAREWLFQHSLIYQVAMRRIGFGRRTFAYEGQTYSYVATADAGAELYLAPPEYWRSQIDPSQPPVAAGYRALLDKVLAARAAAQARGSAFVLILMPFKEQVYGPRLAAAGRVTPDLYQPFYDTSYDDLVTWAGCSGIAVLDLREPFRTAAAAGQRLFWAVDGHYTPAGNAVVADALAARMAGLRAARAPATSPACAALLAR